MIASVQALLGIIESALPQLCSSFIVIAPFLGTPEEANLINELYERVAEVNFSHLVLAHRPGRLAVLKVTGVRWNDLGEPRRVLASLSIAGVRPHWLEDFRPLPPPGFSVSSLPAPESLLQLRPTRRASKLQM